MNTKRQIELILRKLGASGNLLGFSALATAVVICLEDEENLLFVTKFLYVDLAKMYCTTSIAIEARMRNIVRKIWANPDHQFLDEVAGFHLTNRPSITEMIDLLVAYYQRTYLE